MVESNVLCAAEALLSLAPSRFDKIRGEASTVYPPRTAFHKPSIINHIPDIVSCSDNSSDGSVDERSCDGTNSECSTTTKGRPFFTGCTSLALDEDDEFLSPLHCFMRRYCIEAFAAGPEDVVTPRITKAQGKRIVQGQVGLRCLHCKHRAVKKRQERATCFPSSLKNIYHSVETWQRRHAGICEDIPPWVRSQLVDLMTRSKTGAGGRRQYWELSAQRLGMADTENGIRFTSTPGAIVPIQQDKSDYRGTPDECHYPVVRPEDREIVTNYLFLLLDQMETCQFTEDDRRGGRSKVKDCPIGFKGVQCKHCSGKAGFGRYFPTSLDALTSANSDRNTFNHLTKCRKCPPAIRAELQRLNADHLNSKNRRGSRKLFFERVWQRLHGPTTTATDGVYQV